MGLRVITVYKFIKWKSELKNSDFQILISGFNQFYRTELPVNLASAAKIISLKIRSISY